MFSFNCLRMKLSILLCFVPFETLLTMSSYRQLPTQQHSKIKDQILIGCHLSWHRMTMYAISASHHAYWVYRVIRIQLIPIKRNFLFRHSNRMADISSWNAISNVRTWNNFRIFFFIRVISIALWKKIRAMSTNGNVTLI